MDAPKEEKYDLIQNKLQKTKKSRLSSYMELFVGRKGFFALLKYDTLTALFAGCPGALGIFLRGKVYRSLFKKVGKGVLFGKSISIRNPSKISIGDNVIIDDNVMLDAKGTDNQGITIEDGVFIGRNTILSCKNGDIVLRNKANIGFNCYIVSLNYVEVGENTLFAAYAYVIGGGHISEELYVPLKDQDTHGIGIKIGRDAWLGAKSIIMDGCNVGDYSIIGAGAVVTKSVPGYAVAAGIPARIIKDRRDK